MMWGRFVAHQDLQTVLRCHIAAFEALGGAPAEIMYDRMKTAVLGEADDQGIAYNRKLLDLAAHYKFLPKARPPLQGKDEGQSGAPVPLCAGGLLPRRLVSQPRRFECRVPALARHRRQPAPARNH